MNGKEWTKEELERLRRIYPSASTPELLAAFPGRTHTSLRHKASRLGIEADPCAHHAHLREWDDQSLQRLQDTYETGNIKRIAQALGKSPGSVYHKARQVGLKVREFRSQHVARC